MSENQQYELAITPLGEVIGVGKVGEYMRFFPYTEHHASVWERVRVEVVEEKQLKDGSVS